MKNTGVHNGAFGADKFGFKKLKDVKWNLGAPALYEFAIQNGEATITAGGALTAETAYNGLAERGYIVRWLPGQGLPQTLRITIGTAEQMDDIAAALRDMAEAAK